MLKTALIEKPNLDETLNRIRTDQPVGHFSLTEIDELVNGIRNGRFIVFAGEPGAAKTTLLCQLADDAAANGFNVIFNSLEVPTHMLVAKSLSRLSDNAVKVSDVTDQMDSEELRPAIEQYRSEIDPHLLIIDEPLSPVKLGSIIGDIKAQDPRPVILFVDYLQIIPLESGQSPIEERLAVKEAVAGLRQIANAHDIPVIAISSISREHYGKSSAPLKCLGQSSSLDYSADTVILMSVVGTKDERDRNLLLCNRPIVLSVIKNRYAKIQDTDLIFETEFAAFRGKSCGSSRIA